MGKTLKLKQQRVQTSILTIKESNMNITYTWRNADKTDAIEELATKKLEKISRHFDKINQIHIIFRFGNIYTGFFRDYNFSFWCRD